MAIFQTRIASGADDIEQRGKKMSLASTDLELVYDGRTQQIVGLRFTNIDVPPGAIITSAYIQFQTNAVGSATTFLQIRGLASDDLAPFTTANNNLSSRPVTTALVEWRPAAWTTVNEAGETQRSPDLAAIVQEIVGRTGWQAGSDLGFSISGTGTRTAHAYESGVTRAPLLHIEYSIPAPNSPPVLDLDGSAAGTGYATLLAKGTFAVPLADADIVIADANHSRMQSLTATLLNSKPGDTLAVNGALPNGISIANATAATITLTGSASIADYQTAARQLIFSNNSADPDTTARLIEIIVSDGQASSNAATTTITIPNIAPALDLDASASGSGYSGTFVKGGEAIPVADTDVTISDADDTQMTMLMVTLTNARTGDQLLVSGALPNGIALGAGSTATSLILTGPSSIAAYQAAMRQVRFSNTSASPDTTTRQVQVTVSDGQATSSPAVATIIIDLGPASSAAPVLDLDGSAVGSGFTTLFSAGGNGVRIADSDMAISDSDDSSLAGSTVTLGNPKAGDRLLINGALPAGIALDPGSTGTSIILTGAASLAAYETALQQILFDNDDANPDATTRQVQIQVNDGEALSNVGVASIVIDAGERTILERRISASADDVEQRGSTMDLVSSDLELVTDGSAVQLVGLRFTDIQIPAGAVVSRAYIQFQADETFAVATSLQIRGLATDDVAAFSTALNDLSSRATTAASVAWSPPAWTVVDEVGPNQRTTDLTSIIQEIVGRSGWQAGNDLGFSISGTGRRTADAYDGGPLKAPLLHIEFAVPLVSTIDVVLAPDTGLRENVAGARIGSLSIADPAQGETYTYSVDDDRFLVNGTDLRLKDGVRLDFEKSPLVSFKITVTDSSGATYVDTVSAAIADVAETRFAAFGDYGNKSGSQAVAQLVNSLNVDFIVTLGDNVYELTPSIDDQVGNKYASYIGDYHGAYGPGSDTNRFWPSLGNHEYMGDGGGVPAYLDMFTLPGNERYYDFVEGPIHFFVLNSNAAEPDGTSSASIQAQWLKAGLAASTSTYNIVYFHHPPYSSGAEHGSTATLQWPFELWGATAVLSGHDHVYERVSRDDNGDGIIMPYLISGMGGATPTGFLAPVEGSQMRYNADYGTILVQASNESITFEFIAVTGGALIDTFTIDLPTGASQLAASEPAFATTAMAEPVHDPFLPPNFSTVDYLVC